MIKQIKVGDVFTRLTVIKVEGKRGGQITAQCVCSKVIKVIRAHLISGNTKSCGCRRPDVTSETHKKHGEVQHIGGKRIASPEYRSWQSMRNRCLNPKGKDYKYYGGIGITIDSRWDIFENFLFDMGRRISDKHTLERVDSNKGYGPDNCVWATRETQSRNRSYAKTKGYLLAQKLGVKTMTANHYIWRVRKKDKGGFIKEGLSPELEKIVRDHLASVK